MEFCLVSFEAHCTAVTIYMAGFLTESAATQAEEIVSGLSQYTRVIRLDLRAVHLIDPSSFVAVARALNRWRDSTRGHLAIQFPERSTRPRRSQLILADQPSTIGMAVRTAMS